MKGSSRLSDLGKGKVNVGSSTLPRAEGREPRARASRARAIGGILLLAAAIGLGAWRGGAPSRETFPALPAEDARETSLRAAVSAAPEDASARMELGRYYEAQGRPFEAMWEYAEVEQLAPATPDLPLRFAAVLQSGQIMDLAAARLEERVRSSPEDLEARRRLVEIHLATAQPEQARALMEARRAAVWQDADALVLLGRAREAAGDDAGAEAAYRRAVALEYRQDEAWSRLGRLLLRRERHAQARDAFLHAMGADPSRPEYRLFTGLTYLRQKGPGDLERAVSYFREALALRPTYADAHYYSGVAVEQARRAGLATAHYSQAILADPNHADAHRALGRALGAAGNAQESHRVLGRYYDLKDRPQDAVREFERMAKGAGSAGRTALLLSQVYVRTQREREAVAVTEAALKKRPEDLQILERLTVLKINRGDRPAARDLLQRWMELDPKASRPYWLMGRCELGELRYAEGIAWIEKAIERDPRNAHFLGFLGAALLRQSAPGSRERAVEVLGQAVALAPEDPEYRDLYGQALQRVEQFDAARQQFLQALNLDPSRIATFTPVNQLARRLKRPGPAAFFPRATRAVQKRVSEERLLWPHVWDHPEDIEGRMKLVRFFCRTANLSRAADHLEQVLERRPDHPEARALLATLRRCQDAL